MTSTPIHIRYVSKELEKIMIQNNILVRQLLAPGFVAFLPEINYVKGNG